MDKHVSPEAEAAVLGSMMLDVQCCPEVFEKLQERHFAIPEHRILFTAIETLTQNGKELDAILLRNELKRKEQLTAAGGIEYIIKILQSVPSSANASYYATIVHDKWRERELVKYAAKVHHIARGADTADEKILQTEAALHELTAQCTKQEIVCVADYIDQVSFTEQTYISTGFLTLDEYFYGLGAGDMITIAGRPGSGKTCLLDNIATNIAGRGTPVAIFSLEMPKEQLQQRMLCSLARVDLKTALQNRLSTKQEESIEMARGWLRRHQIYIDDTPRLTPSNLRFKVMQLTARHDVRAVFIDYLQLMTAETGTSLTEKATGISQSLKQIALEFGIPVVTAAQLNRMPEQRDGGEPRVSDLRDSGSIEQDSDVVALIHRKDSYDSGSTGHTNVIVGKNRRGATGIAQMLFLGQYTLFTEPICEKDPDGNTRQNFKIPTMFDTGG